MTTSGLPNNWHKQLALVKGLSAAPLSSLQLPSQPTPLGLRAFLSVLPILAFPTFFLEKAFELLEFFIAHSKEDPFKAQQEGLSFMNAVLNKIENASEEQQKKLKRILVENAELFKEVGITLS
jgi:hypothetical protein